jgi:hypothetical protein
MPVSDLALVIMLLSSLVVWAQLILMKVSAQPSSAQIPYRSGASIKNNY